MVDTVGSCKPNKFWNKKWIPIKNSLSLTQKQKELITGSLLGDGTMRLGRNARNANFKVEHGLAQEQYVFWKYGMLKNFVFTEPKISYRYRDNRMKYPKSWWFRTIRHPLMTEIYNQFYLKDGYRSGRKILPDSLPENLSPFALAVWIMDDGSFNRSQIDISTYSFILSEIHRLQDIFCRRFRLKASFYKDRNIGFRIYFTKKYTEELIKIIYPYIIPSMLYKIGFATP